MKQILITGTLRRVYHGVRTKSSQKGVQVFEKY